MRNQFIKAGFGSVGAQAVNLAALPIITRLYAPQEFAAWALVVATAAIFGSVACLRYEVAIVIPEDERDASTIFWLCTVIAAIFGTVIAFSLQLPIFEHFVEAKLTQSLWHYTLAVPFLVVVMGLSATARHWNIRQGKYTANSIAQIGLVAATYLIQISYAIGQSNSATGLVVGSVGGHAIGLAILLIGMMVSGNAPKFAPNTIRRFPDNVTRYVNFLRYSSPYSIFAILKSRATLYIMSLFTSPVQVGLFSLADRAMNVPVALVSSSLRPVIFRESASSGLPRMEQPITRIMLLLAGLCTPFLVFFFFYPTDLFSLVFGQMWAEAGQIGLFLVIPAFTYLFCNWLDRLLDLLGEQRFMLKMEIVFAATSITAMFLGFFLGYGLSGALFLYGTSLVIYNVIYAYYTFKKAGFGNLHLVRLGTAIGGIAVVWTVALTIQMQILSFRMVLPSFAVVYILWAALIWKIVARKLKPESRNSV